MITTIFDAEGAIARDISNGVSAERDMITNAIEATQSSEPHDLFKLTKNKTLKPTLANRSHRLPLV